MFYRCHFLYSCQPPGSLSVNIFKVNVITVFLAPVGVVPLTSNGIALYCGSKDPGRLALGIAIKIVFNGALVIVTVPTIPPEITGVAEAHMKLHPAIVEPPP